MRPAGTRCSDAHDLDTVPLFSVCACVRVYAVRACVCGVCVRGGGVRTRSCATARLVVTPPSTAAAAAAAAGNRIEAAALDALLRSLPAVQELKLGSACLVRYVRVRVVFDRARAAGGCVSGDAGWAALAAGLRRMPALRSLDVNCVSAGRCRGGVRECLSAWGRGEQITGATRRASPRFSAPFGCTEPWRRWMLDVRRACVPRAATCVRFGCRLGSLLCV